MIAGTVSVLVILGQGRRGCAVLLRCNRRQRRNKLLEDGILLFQRILDLRQQRASSEVLGAALIFKVCSLGNEA